MWILLFVCAVLASPVTLDGQEPAVADSSGAQSAERPSEKSLLLIPLLELYVPTLGYSYAGHWRRGIPSGLTRLVGFGLVMHADQFILGEGGRSCEGACALGSVLVIGGTAWAILDAMHLAHRDNQRVRTQRLHAEVAPLLDGARPGMSVRIQWD